MTAATAIIAAASVPTAPTATAPTATMAAAAAVWLNQTGGHCQQCQKKPNNRPDFHDNLLGTAVLFRPAAYLVQ
jgi:hypothetical protein